MIIRFSKFISEDLLIENRIEFIKSRHPTIDTSHDPLAQHKNAGAIIDHFAEKADPSPKKNYTQWIVNQYKKKDFRQEDHPRIHDALSNFEKHQSKLDKKDINQYKSLSDVEDAVEPHLGTVSKKEQKRIVKHEGADLIHDSPTLSVYKLKTKEAACHYGAGTRWCTAATGKNRDGTEKNMFDDYNEKGPVYVVHHKDTGQKHQYQLETDQFMDEKDKRLNMAKEIENHPDLTNVKAFQGHYHFATNKEEFDKALSKALGSKHVMVREGAIRHPKATPEHIVKALKDPDFLVRGFASEHRNVTPEIINRVLNGEFNDDNLKQSVMYHRNVTPENISKALNDKNPHVRYAAIKHRKATLEHVSKALNDIDPDVRQLARNRYDELTKKTKKNT